MISPYQQNIDIIKGFFKKPIVLVLAISSFVCVAYEIILSFFNVYGSLADQALDYFLKHLPSEVNTSNIVVNSGGSGGGLNIIGILFAVVFLLFYILSKKQENKLGAPSVMFKVISIISVVGMGIVTGFVLLFMVLMVALTPSINETFGGMGSSLIFFCFFLGIFMIISLLYSIAQLIFALSIRKSLTSIYLKGKGAMFYGVMCFIQAALGVISTIIAIVGFSNSEIFTLNGTQIAVMCVSMVISVSNTVIAGILAMQYSKYIKNISQRFRVDVPTPADESGVPAQQFPPTAPVEQIPVQPAPIAQGFNPQQIQEQNPFEPVPTQPQPDFREMPPEPFYEQNPIPEQAPIPEQNPYQQPSVNPVPPIQQAPITQPEPQPINPAPTVQQSAPQPEPQPAPTVQQSAPDLTTPRFCTQCGNPIGADDYFCNHCGTKIIRN